MKEEISSAPLQRTPQEFVESLVRDLNSSSRGQTNYSPPQTRRWLRGKGIELWRQLIPARLQELFWEHLTAIKRLTILSSGSDVPWELLYPFDRSKEDNGFLAEQVNLARWSYGTAPSSALSKGNVCFVLPGESEDRIPIKAQEEIEILKKLIGSSTKDVRMLQELLDCLSEAEFDLMHFACHNTFVSSSPSSSYIQMASQRFSPVFLEGLPSEFTRRPFVFMNACRTASSGLLYTDLSGWAEKFLRSGAGAFLGTSWEVRDTSAMLFAEEFYCTLLKGETLEVAMSEGRLAIRDGNDDSTWLAYTLYGDLGAKLSLPDVR